MSSIFQAIQTLNQLFKQAIKITEELLSLKIHLFTLIHNLTALHFLKIQLMQIFLNATEEAKEYQALLVERLLKEAENSGMITSTKHQVTLMMDHSSIMKLDLEQLPNQCS